MMDRKSNYTALVNARIEKLIEDKRNEEGFRPVQGKAICSVSSLTIGFDAPAASLLVLCRPTKVLRLFLQIAGRVARTHPGKEYAELLDLAQCTKEHGFFTEPRPFIKEGDKNALIKAKELTQCDVLSTVVQEEPTEVTRQLVDMKIKELKQKSENVATMEMKDLIAFYDNTIDPKVIIHIAHEIAFRTRGVRYTENTIEWVYEPWSMFIEEFIEHKHRIIKTLKTMSKNKVKAGKKLSALHYVVKTDGWLRQQPPFCYADLSLHQDISDEDIPF